MKAVSRTPCFWASRSKGMFWSAVSAVAGALAAIAALFTLYHASGLEAESVQDRAAETRSVYFKALLTRPLSRAADQLSHLLLTQATSLSEALEGVSDVGQRDALIGKVVTLVNEGFTRLRDDLRVATGAWKDDAITQSLFRETQDWEDETQKAFAEFRPSKDLVRIRFGCTSYRTAVRRILFRADPLLIRAELRALPKRGIAGLFGGA